MIIFGRKHKFTDFEVSKFDNRFKHRFFVRYSRRDPQDVLTELKDLIATNSIRMIVLNTKYSVPNEIIEYLTRLRFNTDISLITIEQFMETYLKKCYIPEDHKDLNYLQDIRPFNFFEYLTKRLMDYLGVVVLFFVSLPIMVYAAIKIQRESPGRLIYKQIRVGVNDSKFYCNKFRSMHEESYHDPYTRENDSRVFPFGKIMRLARIDELPQMINVLKGDMHLIGPRAEWNILVDGYEKEIPYYNERHLVRPGITGWAQVNYPYGSGVDDARQKLMYDLYYIKHYSIWLDIKIILKTILVVLGKKGL